MVKGRKKISDSDKIARGTNQKVRMSLSKPIEVYISKIPPAPKFFDLVGKKIYKSVSQFLIENGLLTANMITIVTAYALEYSKYYQLQQDIKKEGITIEIESKNGFITIVNPKEKISQNCLSQVIKIGSELGITPASASRIIANVKSTKDPDDEFFS